MGIFNFQSNEAFRLDIEREMLRSDRTGVPLTLLLFDIHNSVRSKRERKTELFRLANIVSTHTRATDSKGWYLDSNKLRVGLMLYYTRPEKADRIIHTIREQFKINSLKDESLNGRHAPISCEIFTYPIKIQHRPEILSENSCPTNCAAPLVFSQLPQWKRTLDILIAGIGLVLLSLLFIIIAIIIKLTSKGPVFFKQERIGQFGKPFQLFKFRSMNYNADITQHKEYLTQLIKSENSNEKVMTKLDAGNGQITFFGRIIRMTCLDELPQLVNVLFGDMSLVGPRPCLPYEAEKYKIWHCRRFDSVPGITGLWQVLGKNKTTFQQMIRYDILYSRNISFWMDLKILFLTIPTIISEIRQGFQHNILLKRTS